MNSSPPKNMMFGWEFPPHNSGDLGVACEGLVGGLASLGTRITFVLPRKIDCQCGNCRFVWCGQKNCDTVKTITVSSPLSPYLTAQSYEQVCQTFAGTDIHKCSNVRFVLKCSIKLRPRGVGQESRKTLYFPLKTSIPDWVGALVVGNLMIVIDAFFRFVSKFTYILHSLKP
jgi:hypothetical protein